MRMQQIFFIGVWVIVFVHFLADGTMPKLINQAAAFSVTASKSLQPIAAAV